MTFYPSPSVSGTPSGVYGYISQLNNEQNTTLPPLNLGLATEKSNELISSASSPPSISLSSSPYGSPPEEGSAISPLMINGNGFTLEQLHALILQVVKSQALIENTPSLSASTAPLIEDKLSSNSQQPKTYEQYVAEFLTIIKNDETILQNFIKVMPKGGDTHSHLTGAVDIETLLRYAKRNDFLYDPETFIFYKNKDDVDEALKLRGTLLSSQESIVFPTQKEAEEIKARLRKAADIRGDIFNKLRNKASMNGNEKAVGHNHFFKTFSVGDSIEKHMHLKNLIRDLLLNAKQQKVMYLELMKEFKVKECQKEFLRNFSMEDLESAYSQLEPVLNASLKAYQIELDECEDIDQYKGFREEGFFTPLTATRCEDNTKQQPVVVRWIPDVCRTQPLAEFFADIAFGMLFVKNDPRVVGVTISGQEDDCDAVENFDHQMDIIDFLWHKLGKPKITLHAGELAEGFGSDTHRSKAIRSSITKGHADRIGHGLTLSDDTQMMELVALILENGICIEINLTSNEKIHGIQNGSHPLLSYERFAVPITLNTDDKGVLGIGYSTEPKKAIQRYGFSYYQIKNFVRNQLRYCFIDKERNDYDIFDRIDNFPPKEGENRYKYVLKSDFEGCQSPNWTPKAAAQEILEKSEKVRLQIRLEQDFEEFEKYIVEVMLKTYNQDPAAQSLLPEKT